MSVEFSVHEISLVNLYGEQGTAGIKQKDTFFVQNRYSSSRKVRVALSRDSHPDFHLVSGTDEHYLAAGLKLPVVLQYTPESTGEHQGEIEVYVNEQLSLTIPLHAHPPCAVIKVDSSTVDFGCLVNEHQISSQRFTVRNTGAKEGHFTVHTDSLPPDFTVCTTEGTLQPGQSAEIVVELVCKKNGPFKEEISILTDGGQSIPISLSGELVTRQLQLLDAASSSNVHKISFGDTYYGTAICRKAILFNNSPVVTKYMAVLDTTGVGSEGGVDMSEGLAMACTSGGLGQSRWKEQGDAPKQETVVSVSPPQGSLGPYQKCLIEFSFTPSFMESEVGWTCHQGLPLQRDYSLFVNFMQIGNSGQPSQMSHLEVALTGKACPVQLTLHPGSVINFGTCNTGQSSTVELQMLNESSSLPIDYQCRQLAHYKCRPSCGRLLPGEVSSMAVVFQPKQLGKLNFKLNIDVIGPLKDKEGKTRTGAVYTAVLELRGTGGVAAKGKKERRVKLAHPNDLSTSIRPHDEKNSGVIVTPYTTIPRHTYVDPDYCYTDKEAATQAQLKNTYTTFIKDKHAERIWQEKERSHTKGAPADMSMAPAQGLDSPAVSTTELSSEDPGISGGRYTSSTPTAAQMMTTRDIVEATSDQLEFICQCPSKPLNSDAATQCKKTLSPKDLSQIVIDPRVVEYGSVVVNSIAELPLSIKNYTQSYASFRLKLTGSGVTCTSYGNKPSFQLVLSPLSYTLLPLTMSHSQTGTVERSIEYTVNGHHRGHLPVKAKVTELSLSLSTNTLKLTEPPLARQTAGLHGSVVVSNPHNIPAFFRWLAKEGVETNVFNMLHPSGYVPANGSLECEFVCQPSYESPKLAQFLLDDGRTAAEESEANILSLVAEFKKPTCTIREKRVLFGAISLNMTTTRTIHIDNTGDCHAYYKVIDTSPHPGLRVFPASGVVPCGGAASLKVLLCPQTVGAVDIRVCVALREGKTLSFRLAGLIEQPILCIDQDLFRFGSVFCGAKSTQVFTVSNKGSTSAELTFDLTHLSDFSLALPNTEDAYNEPTAKSDGAGLYNLKVAGKSDAVCKLEFSPKEVAAYDFLLPVMVNGLRAPNPPPSPWPPSQTSSYIAQPPNQGLPSFSLTPMRRVLATGLRPPLLVSHLQFDFQLPVDILESSRSMHHEKVVKLHNVSTEPLTWALGLTSDFSHVEDGTFRFALSSGEPFNPPLISMDGSTGETMSRLEPGQSFSFAILCKPAHHGEFSTTIPLILNGDCSQPYRTLHLSANLPPSQISVVPSCIDLLPVPLGVSLTAQFSVFVEGFTRPVELDIQVPVMKKDTSFSVDFPAGSLVKDCRHTKVEIPCTLEFSSSQPVSISDSIVFLDKTTGKRKRLPFTVCADNTLFSVYKFLAQNVHLSSITLASNVPTLVLQSQSSFDGSSRSGSVASISSQGSSVVKTTALSINPSTTFSDMFHQDCVSAVCRWLSAYGWAEGIKCITLPSDLRVRVGNDLPKAGVKQRSSISTSRGLLVDMLTHLCGRVPPGIPLNLPPCTTASEKVNQQYSTCNTVISFIKSQGGLLWSVVPEALLDYQDYQQWLSDVGGRGSVGFCPANEEEFNELSSQAWTHLLMQIIKVLVLPRCVSQVPKSLKDTVNSTSTLESNVYSKHERVLLTWLNHHYVQQRTKLFGTADLSLTEVLNFDVDLMDCTVLACALTSYCPFLVDSNFSKLFTEPANPEQCTHNAVVFIQALRYAGIDYDLQPNDLVSADPISLLLFTAYLYQRLPAFKAKSSPVLFEGALNSTIKNQIQLSNPSTKTLEYHILIRGSSANDFTVEGNNATILIGGKQNGQLTIKYHARCIAPTESTLLLVAKGGRPIAGSTLAFRLIGNTTSFKPQSTINLTAYQYECQSLSIKVTNTFREAGEFEVRLVEVDVKTLTQSLSPKARKRLNSPSSPVVPSAVLQQRTEDQMQLFNCAIRQGDTGKQLMKIEPNESKLIPMKFVPLKLDSRHCFVVLSDRRVGDIVLSLTSATRPPQPVLPHTSHLNQYTMVNTDTRTLHLKVHAGQSIDEEIVIYSSNEAFENAILEISKWEMSVTELRRRQLTESLRYAALSTAIATLGLESGVKTYRDDQSGESEVLVFSVEWSDQEHFSLPEQIAVPANSRGTARLPVQFYSEVEGQYECHITLRSSHDVRVLVIEATVLAKGRHAHLEFNTHAMQPITQDIPLVNPSTADWPLIVSLTGSGFSGPESLVARALTTTCYPLTFDPHVQGTVQGELRLLNNSDGSEHVFQLTGVAEKPLAQDHITLHAQAKKNMTHILHVPNHNERTSVFRVESDLDFISGPSTITVGGGDIVDYCLNIRPTRQGKFSGAVAFVTEAVSRPHSYNETVEATRRQNEKSPYHVWFHIECIVEPAPPDHSITVSTPTLSTSTLNLTIPNPTSKKLKLEVLVEGHGLTGPPTLDIEPHGEVPYPLTFAPTMYGKCDGRVVFNGSPEGESWYQLTLSAEDPDTVSLPMIQCELGRTHLQTITLRNPLDEIVHFKCENSNTRHFIITGLPEGQVSVNPHSSTDVSVIFNPSALGVGEHITELAFVSKQIGRQIFSLQGEGLPPTSMDPITVNAAIDCNTVHIITFTNPLDLPTHFSIHLKGEDTEHFCLLLKRSNSILLHPGVSLDIPVMFAPEAVYEHNITVAVVAEMSRSLEAVSMEQRQPLCWKYPIVGQPELRPFTPSSAPKITCCAKERLERTLEVSLAGCTASVQVTPNASGTHISADSSAMDTDPCERGHEFSFKLVCSDSRYEELIEQCTGIKLIRQISREGDGEKAVSLEFGIVFAPSKSFNCVCELQVSCPRGGVWLFPLYFSATTASPDDTITIEAKGLNKESQIGFRLTSGNEHPAPFTAYLAPGSDPDMVVSPTSGTLSPLNTKGTLFCVTYKPKVYGRNHQATLIVQSETNEWRYNIIGKPPSYSRQPVSAKVKHKLESPIRFNSNRKNFVSENIQKMNVA